MGHQVEEILLGEGHEIVAIIDNEDDWAWQMQDFETADVAIDFSMPSVAVRNMFNAFEHHVPIVVGTTGWLDSFEEVRRTCEKYNGSLVYGSNFSIGANLFMKLNKELAQLMETQPQYRVALEETHHAAKKDAPSGTAIRLAEDVLQIVDRLRSWQLTENMAVADDVLPVKANRVGTVPGTHTIQWHSEEDDITITHTAHSRKGFALGAVRAAIWLARHPGIYDFQRIALTMNDERL